MLSNAFRNLQILKNLANAQKLKYYQIPGVPYAFKLFPKFSNFEKSGKCPETLARQDSPLYHMLSKAFQNFQILQNLADAQKRWYFQNAPASYAFKSIPEFSKFE